MVQFRSSVAGQVHTTSSLPSHNFPHRRFGTSYLILIMVINIVMLLIGLGAGAAVAWIFASRFLKQAQQQLRDTFGNLSAEALRNNNESFVQMAKVQLEEKNSRGEG